MQTNAISIELHPVKNFWKGRGQHHPVAIVEHTMHGTLEDTFRYFNGELGNYPVSAHYGVGRDGRIWQFVAVEDTAWANGIVQDHDTTLDWVTDALRDGVNLNAITISIEYEGYSGEALTEEQYEAAVELHRQLLPQWNIPANEKHIIGHSQLDRRERAADPGAGFPWARLLQALVNVNHNNVEIDIEPQVKPLSLWLDDIPTSIPSEHSFGVADLFVGESVFKASEPSSSSEALDLKPEIDLHETAQLATDASEEPLKPFTFEDYSQDLQQDEDIEIAFEPSDYEIAPSSDIPSMIGDDDRALFFNHALTHPGELPPPPPVLPNFDVEKEFESFFQDELFANKPVSYKESTDNFIRAAIGSGIINVDLANIRKSPSMEQGTVLRTAQRGNRFQFDGYVVGPELMGSVYWLHVANEHEESWIHSALVRLDYPYDFPPRS
ncbi:MAG: N-acetylmuramoyl-L-alanine amidase [Chloroflexi bacterium]|uniref:N-acetylmuramoyl-L-alanine amidase n=1 Tax=Candidatus Chlorohelix allophototropha TaxID=3003348 RepID=A0A8T7M3D0_9CHLR|nr:N-acetylmuramoyl-L-alanine amidase [Chloroflexota bacterium]WJW67594.1 N-acetylmuramoyl-L-alanine amidase [Chloroflexota bacterium L227-S17]